MTICNKQVHHGTTCRVPSSRQSSRSARFPCHGQPGDQCLQWLSSRHCRCLQLSGPFVNNFSDWMRNILRNLGSAGHQFSFCSRLSGSGSVISHGSMLTVLPDSHTHQSSSSAALVCLSCGRQCQGVSGFSLHLRKGAPRVSAILSTCERSALERTGTALKHDVAYVPLLLLLKWTWFQTEYSISALPTYFWEFV